MKQPYPVNEYVRYVDSLAIEPDQLSRKQHQFLWALNDQLFEIEKNVKREVLTLTKVCEEKISNLNDWVEDYEMDCFITFILKEDDEDFSDDNDNVLVQLTEHCKNRNWEWGLSDDNNHNDFLHWAQHPMRGEKHCWLYHCLYDHTKLGWANVLRIGVIWVDINVEYQKVIRINSAN